MVRKLKSLSNKSAYLQIDFAFAILIFFLVFLFIHGEVVSHLESYEDVIELNGLQADAKDICILLSSSFGSPINWDEYPSKAVFYGFRDSSNFTIDYDKMNFFNNTKYYDILENMNYEKDIYINVFGLDTNTTYVDFGIALPENGLFYSNYVCYSYFESEPVRILVEVWE